MWLLRGALQRPSTVLVAIVALTLLSTLGLARMPVDVFPNLNLPVIYVAQPYGGMSPAQIEGYLVYYYEYHFLYITGIESVESKSIQNVGLLKLTFHPGTDMSQALAQTVSYVNRAHAFMPYGTVPPFVMRFDTGSVPLGYLVFSSTTRTPGEIQDLALNRVRPMFATLPGVSAPPPFGGNQRAVVVTIKSDRLLSYHMSPEEVVQAITTGNIILPTGNINMGDRYPMVPVNSVVPQIESLLDLPIRNGAGPTVFLRDVGSVADATDILAGYALVNGRRTIYLPVTKRADASSLSVVREVRSNLDRFRALVPEDIHLSYEFDQSVQVKNALWSLIREGLLGALLTGLVVLLFLRDRRSAAIVATTIPFALLSATLALWVAGQTMNIMTLGGLALAVGILVDEATVTIENVHTHLARGSDRRVAVLEASREVLIPRLLAMLCVLAVFVPSFFMTGATRSLFVPLSLAVGFAMAASYLLASSWVPILSSWILRAPEIETRPPGRWSMVAGRERLDWILRRFSRRHGLVITLYLVVSSIIIFALGPVLGRELFPRVTAGQLQLRFRAPTGTRVAATEQLAAGILQAIDEEAGPGQVAITLGYVGTQPSAYPVNTIFLWTSGPHEGVLRVALRKGASVSVPELEERLRRVLPSRFPGAHFSFEAGDVVSQIMSFGSPTPIEVVVSGPNFADNRTHIQAIQRELAGIPALRDLQIEEPLDYPSVDVQIDRERAGQLGVTVEQIGRSLTAATSSSRFVAPNYWADPKSGIAYQVQVQLPQHEITTVADLANLPVTSGTTSHPLLGDVASVRNASIVGGYDRRNGQRMLALSANLAGADLGHVAAQVQSALDRAGKPPHGVTVAVRGQVATMQQTLGNLAVGLGVAVVVILLLLWASFQSLRLAAVVLAIVPAAVAGVVLALLVTRTTINLQSFMGAIMATGVAVANAILLVTFAEQSRRRGQSSSDAAMEGAKTRLRPILMTSVAMIAGMIPMALALGSGSEATAPLGRAVIGGLLGATPVNLLVLPAVFSKLQRKAGVGSVSLMPG